MKKLPVSILFIFVSILSLAQKKDLSLNLKVGEVYRQVTKAHIIINQNFMGEDMHISVDVNGSMSYKVLSETKDVYALEVSYNSLSMTMEMPGSEFGFSSEDQDQNNLFSSILASMVNNPFYMSMTKKGKVSEVKNVDTMWDSVINKFDIPLVQREQIKEQMLKDYGPESIKESTEAATAIFPEQAVSVGDTWNSSQKIGTGFKLDVNTLFTLKEVDKEFYVIEGNSQLVSIEMETTENADQEFDLKGTMNSTIKVDAKTGWVLESNVSQSLEGQTFMTMDPSSPEKAAIPISIETKTSVTNK